MDAFTAAQLARMRATLDASLPDSCAISRPTRAADGAGGWTETWATVATVACRVAPDGKPADQAIAQRLGVSELWVVTLPALTAVQIADRLVAGGVTYEVVSAQPHSWEVGRRVICKRLE